MANTNVQRNRESQKSNTVVRQSAMKSDELFRRGYNFAVYLEGKMIPFQRVSGLSAECGFESVQEGGRNTVVYSLQQPFSGERVLTLERGLLTDEAELTLYQPGYQMRKEIAVYVLGHDGSAVKSYYLRGCVIRKVSVSELNASSSAIAIANIEIIYRTLEEDGNMKNSASWSL